MKIIVIGLNHAGTTAVRAIRNLDKKAKIVGYDMNDNISFLGCGIALWVNGMVKNPKDLFYATPELLKKENIEVHMKHKVVELDESKKRVKVLNLTTGKETYDTYDKLVIAAGSWPIVPPFEGKDLKNILITKWYQHGAQIQKINASKTKKTITIIGAGYIGVELAEAFRMKGHNVNIVDLSPDILSNYYDAEFTKIAGDEFKKKGIKLFLGEKVVKFTGNKKGEISEVITDKRKIKTDYAILSVGFRPSTEWLKSTKVKLAPNGGIITNEYAQTSNKDIYAIGDCAQVFDNSKNSLSNIALATTAVRSGVVAALNIVTNNKKPGLGYQGSNAIKVYSQNLAATGLTFKNAIKLGIDADSYTLIDNDVPEFLPTHMKKATLKVVWNKKTREIIGAQIASQADHTELIHMFSLAILKKFTIDELPLLDIFFLPHFNKPYNLVTTLGLKACGLNWMDNKK